MWVTDVARFARLFRINVSLICDEWHELPPSGYPSDFPVLLCSNRFVYLELI